MLERFVRVKTSTEASRDHDAKWEWSLRRPARPTRIVLPLVTYVASVYVFEFVCILYVIIFTSNIFLEPCKATRTTISVHHTV